MKIDEEETIKKLLESQYADVCPPQHLRSSIIRTIEFIKTLKELGCFYTRGLSYVLRQWKTEGGKI